MIRLHIPGIPYTITRGEYSHDAYTGKVLRFSPMMRSLGYEVYHYGIETSESGATKNIELMTKDEWTELRIKSWQFVDKNLTYEEAVKRNSDPTQVISQLSNWSSPLSKEFNIRFRKHLIQNYRSNSTDIVCNPLARTYESAIDKLNYVAVETGIGYSGSYLNYRIFESYAWLSSTLGRQDKMPSNYWFVVPNYFDTSEFKLSLTPLKNRIGFLGRINDLKGCRIIMEIARKFPDIEFILCGQGDPKVYLEVPNIKYKNPIHGSERSDYLGSCMAVLCLSKYLEPFCGVAVEAQLCGTPVISTDWGAMVETVEQSVTGLRGHTLADYCYGVQMALDSKFDRQYIRDRAVRLYDMYNVAKQYDYTFRTILDIHTPGKNGWYSPDTHIKRIYEPHVEEKLLPLIELTQKRIYIFIPYYGAFPNYFQLYLDSLGLNTDILTVFLITDIDMTGYVCPTNLVIIKMPKSDIQKRASKFILDTYEKVVEPENLIKDNYKFVDFKIVLPLLFDDLLKNHNVTEDDFVGWGDIDLIYGKLSNFIDLNKGYGILGGWHGHFAAIQNTDSFKNNFKTIPNFLELITDNSKTFITDEIAYREPLKAYLNKNNIKMFYANAHFCDIVPPCFFHMSRPDYKTFEKNFYDLYNPYKNIKNVVYDKSKLMVHYDDGSSRETLYCHLQKRKMDLPFKSYDTYYINESGFSVIPQNIWQTWETKDLSPKMLECVDKLKKNNPTFTYHLFDNADRRKFIKDNFPEEVVLAYDALIPGAYRADLWRYCVLYIHGGIYMDIKLQFEEGSLKDYINNENFVSDSSKIKETCDSVYNGFIVSKKGNLILLKSIINIVYNVSKEYYGENPWAVTGPKLLGKNYKESEYKPDIDLIHYGPVSNETIKKGEQTILIHYPEYRTEQSSLGTPYYKKLWDNREIYKKTTIDLLRVYQMKTWPEHMLKELARYMV